MKSSPKFVVWGLLSIAITALLVVFGAGSQSLLMASPLPTPTPPGGGSSGGGVDWLELLEWVMENWELLSNLILLIITLIVAWLGRGQVAKRYGIELMLEAEQLARAEVLKSGADRMEHVVSTLVMNLPRDIKTVLRLIAKARRMTLEEMAREIAQAWFDKATGSD